MNTTSRGTSSLQAAGSPAPLLRAAALMAVSALCAATHAVAAPSYACQLLDADGITPEARAINDRNEVVGEFDYEGDPSMRWDRKGKAHVLKAPKKASQFQVRDINNDGVAVGAIFMPNQFLAGWTAQKWLPDGTYATLPELPEQETHAKGINNLGTIVGWGQILGQPHQALVWTEAGQTQLPPLVPGMGADARAINDHGTVVGAANKMLNGQEVLRAVRWRNGKAHDLGTLPGAKGAVASAVNETGLIVGVTTDNQHRPVAWVDGVAQELDTLDTHWGEAVSVNRGGEIVGSTAGTGVAYWSDVNAPALAINDLIADDQPCMGPAPFSQPASLVLVGDINSRGVITATGEWEDPISHFTHYSAYRLVPVKAAASTR